MVMNMLMHYQPPVQQTTNPTTELPLFPGSDPEILAAYEWTLAHSPSLQQVVHQLANSDQKARYRLIPGYGTRYNMVVTPINGEYIISIEVPILAWEHCEDALEPWIASALFVALEVINKEKYLERAKGKSHSILTSAINASFIFQRKVKIELALADPKRLKDLPDGARIYESGFRPTRFRFQNKKRLPGTLPSDGSSTKQTKVPVASVVVEDRPITLPTLPQDGEQARTQFKNIHLQIRNAIEDLNQALLALYGRPEAESVLPPVLSVPSVRLAEGVELLGVINDPEFSRIERAYLDTWKGWQAALVEGGLAKPLHSSTGALEPSSKEYQEAKQKAKQVMSEPSRMFGAGHRLDPMLTKQEPNMEARKESRLNASYLDDLELPPNKTLGGKGGTGGVYANKVLLQPDELIGYIKKENDVFRNQMGQAIASNILINLSETWNPLVNHLNISARRIQNQEWTPDSIQDATMDALRIHAKLAVMERFRKALWYCDLVWCQLASAEAPPPPQRLSPPNSARSKQ